MVANLLYLFQSTTESVNAQSYRYPYCGQHHECTIAHYYYLVSYGIYWQCHMFHHDAEWFLRGG